jgi:CHAT domain-containing protein/Tfp pilus assembly protein PilF
MKKIIFTILVFLFLYPVIFAQSWKEFNEKTMSYYKNGDYENAEIFGKKGLEQCEKEYGKNSGNYIASLTNLAFIYEKVEKYDLAEEHLKNAVAIRKNISGENNYDYAISLWNLSNLYREIAKFNEAELILLEYMEIIKQLKGEKNENYAEGLDGLAHCYTKKGNFNDAEKTLLKSIEIKKEVMGVENPSYSVTLNDLGVLYGQTGRYEEAEKYIKEALRIDKIIYGDNSPDYATDLNNLALLYCETGQYNKAEMLLKDVEKIRKKTLSEKDPSYVSTLGDLGLLYDDMGRYEEAEKLYKKVIKITKEVLGTKNEYYAQYLNSLATLYSRTQRQKEAESLFKECLEIVKSLYGESSPYLAYTLNNIAWFYKSTGNFYESEKIYLQANKITKDIYGEKHPLYATSLGNIALLNIKMGNYEKAEKLLLEAINIRKEVLGEKHPDYINSISNLAELYTATNRLSEAEPIYKKTNENLLNLINTYYPYLSEKEKLQFLKTIENRFEQFNSFALKRLEENPLIANDMLELSLAIKGIILSSSTKVRNNILNSGDSALIADYTVYVNLKNILIKAISASASERQKKSIDIEKLESEVNELEKNLSYRSEVFSSDIEKRKITINDLKKEISEKEAIVDYINFHHIDSQGVISSVYGALVVRKDFENPVFIKLCNEKDLEKILSAPAENRNSYVKNFDNSYLLYGMIWEPIEPLLKKISVIKLSTAGLLNKISFVALSDPDDKLLFDKYIFNNYGNPKDIVLNEKEEKADNKTFSASVFGGAIFDMDSSLANNSSVKFSRGEGEDWVPPSGNIVVEKSMTTRKWSYLPGTLIEAKMIDSLLKSRNIISRLEVKENACKDEIKNLNFKNSPAILHIATHGYFFPEPLKEPGKTYKMNKFQLSGNPLIRSGLILSGANRIWMGEEEIEGTENGVLTALDISNLDLINTKLVVLSACETGLGDIKGGEGVYGLQRAFKVAGAKTIIMSLWKVPDKETVELMELFYTNWLDGMIKHEAFTSAQKEMRKKYPPYYWAAFVMVE